MTIYKKISFLIVLAMSFCTAFSQQFFSISSDVALQRNFRKDQRYWAIGHSTQTIFHLNPKEAVVIAFSYYSNGKFSNSVTATAKNILTIPQQINYTNKARMGLQQFSIGYRNYFKGRPDIESGWSLYGTASFGVEFGRVDNTHSVFIDTATYNVPVRMGKAHFKRLSIDFGLGYEMPLSGDCYLYSELRTWIPTTDYPSKYIFANTDAPLVAMFAAGIRILF